jgi:tetrahydromethanopterin S-methyltransferase subunit A
MEIEYQKADGRSEKFSEELFVSKIKKGNNRFDFSPLEIKIDSKVRVKFSATTNIEPLDGLVINNQDYNPDPERNTAERIIYRETVKDLTARIIENLNRDQRFAGYYSALIYTLSAVIVILLIFQIENRK